MATTTHLPVEQYLHRQYEVDADYVDGVIEERNLGENDHSKWQLAVQHWFLLNAETWNVLVRPELRIRVTPTRYRIADVTILNADQPQESIPTHPPLIVFEILSPEDILSRVRKRLADFATMGIPEIWLIDPQTGSFDRFHDGQLTRLDQFDLADRGISFPVSEIARRAR